MGIQDSAFDITDKLKGTYVEKDWDDFQKWAFELEEELEKSKELNKELETTIKQLRRLS